MPLRKIGILSHTYRNIHRYRQILAILFKYGFDDLVDRLHLGPYFKMGIRMISGRRRREVEILSSYERLRMALEELGPIFIKMGQVISTRPDLIPVGLIQELTKLQDNVPPFPFSQVRETVEQELGPPLGEIFLQFQESSIAAASIGQVHRAQLRTGEQVVVKVQRPGIRRIIEADLEILFHLATLIERYVKDWEIYSPTRIVDEIDRTLKREINYTIEASYTERFARQFAGKESIYVPRIFRQATTERVLTMEYVDGIKASDVALLDERGFDRKVIASRINDLILEQIFEHRFFHADPHPGNVFILPGNRICYLDFGMMGRVDRQSREHFADIVVGYIRHDELRIADAILRIVEWDEEPNRRALENDISNFIEMYFYRPLKELRIGDIFQELLDLTARHKLRLPPDNFLIGKALTETEGLGLILNPDFDMTRETTPFVRKLMLERMHPKRLVGDFITTTGSLFHLLREIPREFHEVLKQLKEGKAKIVFQHEGSEEHFISERDRSSNRIAFSLIISSLIIGSSLVIVSNSGPYLFGFSLLGILGYLAAAVLGLWLLIAIFRSGSL